MKSKPNIVYFRRYRRPLTGRVSDGGHEGNHQSGGEGAASRFQAGGRGVRFQSALQASGSGDASASRFQSALHASGAASASRFQSALHASGSASASRFQSALHASGSASASRFHEGGQRPGSASRFQAGDLKRGFASGDASLLRSMSRASNSPSLATITDESGCATGAARARDRTEEITRRIFWTRMVVVVEKEPRVGDVVSKKEARAEVAPLWRWSVAKSCRKYLGTNYHSRFFHKSGRYLSEFLSIHLNRPSTGIRPEGMLGEL